MIMEEQNGRRLEDFSRWKYDKLYRWWKAENQENEQWNKEMWKENFVNLRWDWDTQHELRICGCVGMD